MPKFASPDQPRPRSWWLVLSLLVLAPVCAEYLSAYDDSTGHPTALVQNMIVFIPLYGCAALLVREVARRARLGWTGMLLLAAAFGLVQAGLVDQSLFSPDYRGLAGWEAMFSTTLVAPLGLSAVNLISFVGGHVMLSICGPIALVESWRPARASEPWLRLPGLLITTAAYVGASLFVLRWHLLTESWHASAGQLIGTGVVVAAVIIAAAALGRRVRPHRADGPGPGLGLTALVSLALATTYNLLPQTWPGVAGSIAVLVVAGWLLGRVCRTRRWSATHAAVAGSAPLLLTGLLAFTYDPLLGEVGAGAKYAHNVIMLGIVLVTVTIAVLRRRPTGSSDRAGTPEQALTEPADSREP